MATFTNQATLSYNGRSTNSNIATGELIDLLTATKTAVADSYRPGDEITYAVSVVNTDTTPYNGITLADDLGGGANAPLTYVDGSLRLFIDGELQPTPATANTAPLSLTGISVPVGSNALILYQATVNNYASPEPGSTLTNTVTVAAGGSTTTAAATLPIAEAADLAISKSISPTTVRENGRVTYTFTVFNYGNSPVTADGDAVITDTFAPVLSDLAVAFNGAAWTEGTNYTYTGGTFTTLPGQITVPAATFTQSPTGEYVTTPGVSTLTVTGTL